jgi:anti-anti-sigma regulatory factor
MAVAGEDGLLRQDGAEPTPFGVCVVTTTGRVDVNITGEVDLTTRNALEGVLDAACSLEPYVRLDLAGLSFLDPQGALLLARRQAAHPRFEITAASAAVRRIVDLLGEVDGAGPVPRIGGSAYDSRVT